MVDRRELWKAECKRRGYIIGMPPGYERMPTDQANWYYQNRCCDWHVGDSGGVGDFLEPCRGERFPGRRNG